MKIFLQRPLFVLAGMLLTATTFSQTIIVSKCDMNGWHAQKNNGNSQAALSTEPNPAPGSPGSGRLSVGKNGDNSAQFTSGNYFKQSLLSSFTELKYSTYVEQNGSSGKAPFILLDVDYDGDGAAEDQWIFEPAYQSTAVSIHNWQSWNALTGKWYTAKGLAGSGPGTNTKTWSQLLSAKPAVRLLNSHTFKFVAGTKKGPWDNFIGNIDNIIIGINGQSTSFDLVCTNTGASSISCPGNVEVSTGYNTCSAAVAITAPGATDACGNPIATATGVRSDGKSLSDSYPKGVTTVTWTAAIDASGNTVSCTQTVTVTDNQAPVLTCPSASHEKNTDEGVCSYTVQGGEFDPSVSENCSFTISYTMTGATEGSGSSSLAGVVLNKGTTTISWVANDGTNSSAPCSFTVTVVDNQPPVLSDISATPNVLWAPNHKMTDVELFYTVKDNCGDYQAEIFSITSDEHENGLGDGNTAVDWEVVDEHHVRLRAERSGLGDGRVYTVTVKVWDEAGNTDYGTVTVSVPHDQSSLAQESSLEVVAAPNPTQNSFIITVNSMASSDKISLVVANANGTVVHKLSNIAPGQTINFGESFPTGTYYAEFRQGATTKKITLLKL